MIKYYFLDSADGKITVLAQKENDVKMISTSYSSNSDLKAQWPWFNRDISIEYNNIEDETIRRLLFDKHSELDSEIKNIYKVSINQLKKICANEHILETVKNSILQQIFIDFYNNPENIQHFELFNHIKINRNEDFTIEDWLLEMEEAAIIINKFAN